MFENFTLFCWQKYNYNLFISVLFHTILLTLFVWMQPFWKVNPDGSSKGMGVVGIFLVFRTFQFSMPRFYSTISRLFNLIYIIGVLETNFIEPAHDKQDFERSLLFIRLEARLKQMTYDYWFVTSCYIVYLVHFSFVLFHKYIFQFLRRLYTLPVDRIFL